jgi:hypothetical protein
MKTTITILIISMIITCLLSFSLGRRYESYAIKIQIEQQGYAVSRWGDNSSIIIQGTVEALP